MDKITNNYFRLVVLIFFVSYLSIGYHNCKQNSELLVNEVIDIPAGEARELIDQNQGNPNFIILDVRTATEYNIGHIENAINIDFNSHDFETRISQLNETKIYLVYCRSGNRSAQATSIMKGLGFQTLYNLLGGISQWVVAGYHVVAPN